MCKTESRSGAQFCGACGADLAKARQLDGIPKLRGERRYTGILAILDGLGEVASLPAEIEEARTEAHQATAEAEAAVGRAEQAFAAKRFSEALTGFEQALHTCFDFHPAVAGVAKTKRAIKKAKAIRVGVTVAACAVVLAAGAVFGIPAFKRWQDGRAWKTANAAAQSAGEDYEKAAESYRNYMQTRPNGRYTEVAKKQIEVVLPQKIEERDWKRVEAQVAAAGDQHDRVIALCQDFVSKHPFNRYNAEAKRIIAERSELTAERDWKLVQKSVEEAGDNVSQALKVLDDYFHKQLSPARRSEAATFMQNFIDRHYAALMDRGKSNEQAKNWSAATDAYEKAGGLKPNMREPREAIERVKVAARQEQFDAAMKEGERFEARKDWDNARAAYERAANAVPYAPKPGTVYTARLSGIDDEAWLYVNGKRVSETQWGKRGTDSANWQSIGHQPGDSGEIDITSLLLPGTNSLRAVLRNWPGCCGTGISINIKKGAETIFSDKFQREDSAEGIKYDKTFTVVLETSSIPYYQAREAIDRIKTARIESRVAELKTKARDAEAKKDWVGAREAYLEIRRIKPSDREAEEGLKRIEAMELGLPNEAQTSAPAGGTSYLVQIDLSNIDTAARPQALVQTIEIVRKRVVRFGIAEPIIQPIGQDRILVKLPGLEERLRQEARRTIERTVLLEFRLVHERNGDLVTQSQTDPRFVPPVGFEKMRLDETRDGQPVALTYFVANKPELTGKYVEHASVQFDQFRRPYMTLSFDTDGAAIFGRMTTANVGRQLAIVVDGELFSVPVIHEPMVTGRAQITGQFSLTEAQQLANVLENPLDAPVMIVEERGMDSPPPAAQPSAPAGGTTEVRLWQATFSYVNPNAQTVNLAGEFNGWNTTATPMTRDASGVWKVTVPLKPGYYGYKFVVNGSEWVFDPSNPARKIVGDIENSAVSVGGAGSSSSANSSADPATVTWLDPAKLIEDCWGPTGEVLSDGRRIAGALPQLFQEKYRGKQVKYSGVVDAIKKAEGVVVFKGGGTWPKSYHVEASFAPESVSVVDAVKKGQRLVVQGELVNLVPPLVNVRVFGVGPSNSIRLGNAVVVE